MPASTATLRARRSSPTSKSRACWPASRTTPTTWATATAARRSSSRAFPRNGSSRFSRWPTRPSPPSSRCRRATRPSASRRSSTRRPISSGWKHPRLVHLAPALVGPSHPRLALRNLPQDHRRPRRSRRLRPLRLGEDHAGDRRSRHLVLLGPAAGFRLRLAEISGSGPSHLGRKIAPTSTPFIPPACWSPASTFSSSGSRA
jgi:hypothetical protein